jgi:hypothetical protein
MFATRFISTDDALNVLVLLGVGSPALGRVGTGSISKTGLTEGVVLGERRKGGRGTLAPGLSQAHSARETELEGFAPVVARAPAPRAEDRQRVVRQNNVVLLGGGRTASD